MTGVLIVAALFSGQVQTGAQTPAREVIAEVRVHGNQVVPDVEVLRLAGVVIGAPFTDTTIAEITARLRDSRKFESVEVLKRFASIEDPSRIVVVIIASEGPVRVTDSLLPGGNPQVVQRGVWRNLMFIPILDLEDGYGVTFGARIAYPHPIGPRSRLSSPLTWGGMKRAGVELDRTFTRGPFSRIEFGAGVQRRRNPAYDEDDDRRRVWARAERATGPFRMGATVNWQRVAFGAIKEDMRSLALDGAIDTRLDPVLPRNAVFVSASIERFYFSSGAPALNRTRVDARAYIGFIGQQVLVVRGLREAACRPEPIYLRSLLGGWSNLRGFETGFLTGDTLVAASVEWRAPITSPLSVGKLGISLFADWGTAYDKGQRFSDQTLHQGLGGSLWFSVAAFRLSVGVAHGRDAGTRVNFGGGLTF